MILTAKAQAITTCLIKLPTYDDRETVLEYIALLEQLLCKVAHSHESQVLAGNNALYTDNHEIRAALGLPIWDETKESIARDFTATFFS